MARSINTKCSNCSKLCHEEAIEVHGPNGDGCWDDTRCLDRRSSYRLRAERNQKRRDRRAQKTVKPLPHLTSSLPTGAEGEISLEVEVTPYATSHWYRFKDSDRIHALGGELWLGDQRVAVCGPVHLLGSSPTQVKTLLLQMLQKFSRTSFELCGKKVNGFVVNREFHPSDCPAKECPLRSTPLDALALPSGGLPVLNLGLVVTVGGKDEAD